MTSLTQSGENGLTPRADPLPVIPTARLEAAIRTYNEYHSPMATADLVEAGETFTVRFHGPFCRMCCDYDYFEDYVYELDEYGVDPGRVDVTEIEYEGDETFRVEFAVED